MKKILMLVLLCSPIVGCSGEYPIQWKASEAQKQAADLAVTDTVALTPYVADDGQSIRAEAEQAAKVTQTYVGLPAERPMPVAAYNPVMLSQAGADASRPRPTIGQVGAAVTDEIQRGSDTVFSLADSILALVATVAGTWGATKVVGKIGSIRGQRDELQARVDTTLDALKQTVQAVDQLPPDVKSQVKAVMGQYQQGETPVIVAAIKNNVE